MQLSVFRSRTDNECLSFESDCPDCPAKAKGHLKNCLGQPRYVGYLELKTLYGWKNFEPPSKNGAIKAPT